MNYKLNDIKKNILENFDLNYLIEENNYFKKDKNYSKDYIMKKIDWYKIQDLYNLINNNLEKTKNNHIKTFKDLNYIECFLCKINENLIVSWNRNTIYYMKELKEYLNSIEFITEIIYQFLKDYIDFWK